MQLNNPFCVVFLYFSVVFGRKDSVQQCGIPYGMPETSRIVGGYPVGFYRYPWFGALIRGKDEVYCGSTLVKPRILLTAAHCFRQWLASSESNLTKLETIFTIKLGVYNKCQSEKTQQTFTAKKVHVHEKYRKKDPYFDIALIELNEDTSAFMPACLPEKSLSSETRGKEGLVQGFGNMKYGDNTEPCEMKEARILLYSDDVCKKMLKSQDEDEKEFINAFCAGYMEGGIDACQGDSGGPLVVKGKQGHTVLMGITSFGFKCADKDVLGLYTDVSRYLDWIKERAGNTSGTSPPTLPPGSSSSVVKPTQNGTNNSTDIDDDGDGDEDNSDDNEEDDDGDEDGDEDSEGDDDDSGDDEDDGDDSGNDDDDDNDDDDSDDDNDDGNDDDDNDDEDDETTEKPSKPSKPLKPTKPSFSPFNISGNPGKGGFQSVILNFGGKPGKHKFPSYIQIINNKRRQQIESLKRKRNKMKKIREKMRKQRLKNRKNQLNQGQYIYLNNKDNQYRSKSDSEAQAQRHDKHYKNPRSNSKDLKFLKMKNKKSCKKIKQQSAHKKGKNGHQNTRKNENNGINKNISYKHHSNTKQNEDKHHQNKIQNRIDGKSHDKAVRYKQTAHQNKVDNKHTKKKLRFHKGTDKKLKHENNSNNQKQHRSSEIAQHTNKNYNHINNNHKYKNKIKQHDANDVKSNPDIISEARQQHFKPQS